MSIPGKVLLPLIITMCLLKCTDNAVGSVKDSYTGDFELISIEPPLNTELNACDTIHAVFCYTLPPRITDNDTVFDFYLSFYKDTVIAFDNFEYRPTAKVSGNEVKSTKPQDTLSIKCPVNKLLKLDISTRPVEFRFVMQGETKCSDDVPAGGRCWDSIEYRETYRYESVDTSACR